MFLFRQIKDSFLQLERNSVKKNKTAKFPIFFFFFAYVKEN